MSGRGSLAPLALLALLAGGPPARAQDAPAPPSALTTARVQALLARFAWEPPVGEVVASALAAARHDPGRFAAMASRARLRGLLPELAVSARRGQGVDLRTTATDDTEVKLSTDDDLVLQASLRFDLGRLLFASEEPAIAREARAERGARLLLVRDVVTLYFRRKRLLLERELAAPSALERELQLAEAGALLDDFTNGAFGRMMAARRKRWTTGAVTSGSRQR